VTYNNSWNVADAGATAVTFNESATTATGTDVYVVGSIPALGGWDPSAPSRRRPRPTPPGVAR
jgi:alpha-amylase